jgi:hypothetical protein
MSAFSFCERENMKMLLLKVRESSVHFRKPFAVQLAPTGTFKRIQASVQFFFATGCLKIW